MKAISVLGSTGSIGTQTLQIAEEFPDQFRVVALTAGRNVSLLVQQIQRHQPELDAMAKALMEDRELVGKRLEKMLESITPDTGILELSARETANDKETNQPR